MVNFYVNRIKNGLMKVEEVPKLWKQRVLDIIDAKS